MTIAKPKKRGRAKTHEITIKVKFNAEVGTKEARYAVWNAIHDYDLYGDGKPRRGDDRTMEPYDTGRISVRR